MVDWRERTGSVKKWQMEQTGRYRIQNQTASLKPQAHHSCDRVSHGMCVYPWSVPGASRVGGVIDLWPSCYSYTKTDRLIDLDGQICVQWWLRVDHWLPVNSPILKLDSGQILVELYNKRGTDSQGSTRQPLLNRTEGSFVRCLSIENVSTLRHNYDCGLVA